MHQAGGQLAASTQTRRGLTRRSPAPERHSDATRSTILDQCHAVKPPMNHYKALSQIDFAASRPAPLRDTDLRDA